VENTGKEMAMGSSLPKGMSGEKLLPGSVGGQPYGTGAVICN